MLRIKKLNFLTLEPWNLLVFGILLASISPYLSLACYIIFILFGLFSPQKRANQLSKKTIFLLAFLSIALLSRVSIQWGWGLHSIKDPMLFPVTIVDYLLIIFFLGLTSHLLIYKNQVKKIIWFLAITVWFEFLFCFLEKFCGLKDNLLAFPNHQFGILKVFLYLNYLDQVTGSYFHPNNLGLYSLICFPVLVSLILYYWYFFLKFTKHQKYQKILFKIKTAIAILVITFFLISLIILWSKSRQAQLLYLFEIFIALLFFASKRIKLLIVFSGIALCFSIYLASNDLGWVTTMSRQFIPSEIWERFSSLHQQSFRLNVFQCALSHIKSNPLFGLGIGAFAIKCENELGFFINHAHNIILQILCDIGIPFGIILGYLKVSYWRKSYQNIMNKIKNKDELNFDKKQSNVSIFLVIGFFMASINTIILSMVSLSVFQSYRLLFLYGITLLIPYTFSLDRPSFSFRRRRGEL